MTIENNQNYSSKWSKSELSDLKLFFDDLHTATQGDTALTPLARMRRLAKAGKDSLSDMFETVFTKFGVYAYPEPKSMVDHLCSALVKSLTHAWGQEKMQSKYMSPDEFIRHAKKSISNELRKDLEMYQQITMDTTVQFAPVFVAFQYSGSAGFVVLQFAEEDFVLITFTYGFTWYDDSSQGLHPATIVHHVPTVHLLGATLFSYSDTVSISNEDGKFKEDIEDTYGSLDGVPQVVKYFIEDDNSSNLSLTPLQSFDVYPGVDVSASITMSDGVVDSMVYESTVNSYRIVYVK